MIVGIKQKKGVSVIIGYVLLIVFAIIISAGVYTWLKTYVPSQSLGCPDSASLFVKEANFNSSLSELTVKVRNNGRFDVAGYFIYASNNSNQSNPTIELSQYLNEDEAGIIFGSSVLLSEAGGNTLGPGEEKTNTFEIPAAVGEIYSIRIIPTRFQTEDNKERFVSCAEAKVQQIVGEPSLCTPSCSGKICGDDGCGGSCGSCNSGFFCDDVGQCISGQCTPATNATQEAICGSFVCGTRTNGTCGQVDCGTCSSNSTCNITVGQCVSNCGNGVIDSGEQCDGTNLSGQTCLTQGFTAGNLSCSSSCQFNTTSCTTTIGNGVCDAGETCAQEPVACEGYPATCTSGNICISGSCQAINQSGVGCTNYCISLVTPYTSSTCVGPPGQCSATYSGTLQSGGNQYCPASATNCCCIP